jgi:hypothetical protein
MSEHDPAYDIARALTDHKRSFRAIADAFVEAADAGDELTQLDRAGRLVRALVDRYMLVDQIAFVHAMMAMTGYLAERTGKTPRQVHEEMFEAAPDDAWWRAKHAEST